MEIQSENKMITYLGYIMVSGITKYDVKSYFCLNINFIINHTLEGNIDQHSDILEPHLS